MLDRSAAINVLLGKYKDVSKDKPLHVILDPGNTDIKVMLHEQWGQEKWFPHIVDDFPLATYPDIEGRYKNHISSMNGTAVFKMEKIESGFVIGIHAKGEKRITGAKKYTREYMSPLFIAAMLQVYPVSHLNVRLVVLHPANITNVHKENLLKALGGTHSAILPNGDSVTYKVKSVVTIEEVAAGFQSFFFAFNGKTDKALESIFRINDRALVIDIGGHFSSFLPIERTSAGLEVNMNKQGTFEIGIQHVQEALNEELKHEFTELADQDSLPINMINHALKTGTISISGGDEIDCTTSVKRAMEPLTTKISNEYRNRYNGGVGFQAIIISGGGGGIAYNFLTATVLNHKRVKAAEKHDDLMRFANIRGASKGYKHFLAYQQKEKLNGQKEKRQQD